MYVRITLLENTVYCPLNLDEISHGKCKSLVFFLLTESAEQDRYAGCKYIYIYIERDVFKIICAKGKETSSGLKMTREKGVCVLSLFLL